MSRTRKIKREIKKRKGIALRIGPKKKGNRGAGKDTSRRSVPRKTGTRAGDSGHVSPRGMPNGTTQRGRVAGK